MESMFREGFLGTRAPFFMDSMTLIVSLLPFLVGFAIWLAKKHQPLWHQRIQWLIFILSVVVIGYFEYGVRVGGGYALFVQQTSIPHHYVLTLLVVHIMIATVTLGVWIHTLLFAQRHGVEALKGELRQIHKRSGLRTFMGICLTAMSGVWVYLLLFLF